MRSGPLSRARGRRDFGRAVARILCALFAVVGALPLLGGWLVRTRTVLDWAGRETARVLSEELGVTASYRVEVGFWPLSLVLTEVVVPSTDGGSPALEVERIAVKPRVFSLLGGRLDAGDIEIDGPKSRVVIIDGRVVNVAYRLPDPPAPSKARSPHAPFATLAVSDAAIALQVDDMLVETAGVDLDVFTARGPTFELALRAGRTRLTRERAVEGVREVDEDVICRLDARVHVEGEEILVRRFSLVGAGDDDAARETRPACSKDENDARRVAIGLSQVRVELRDGGDPAVRGHVVLRAPTAIVNRFARTLPLSGWIGVSADVDYDGTARLPNLSAKVRGERVYLGAYRLAERVQADVRIENERILAPSVAVDFANGTVTTTDLEIDPFAEGITLAAKRVAARGIDFPGLMRDLDVTPNTVVQWDHDEVIIDGLHGTLSPVRLDANLDARTSNFEVFDRAYHDPGRRHMIGVRAAAIKGRIGVRPQSFEFYETRASFGQSSIVTSVSLGFKEDLRVTVAEGSRIDLADITPLADVAMAGKADLTVRMSGKFNDPTLTGTAKIADLNFGGFPIGDVISSEVHFRPLELAISNVRGKKGKSTFFVPTAKVDFDADATLIADAQVESEDLDLRDFFAMWHFDEDPRFAPIFGGGRVSARVHYDLGGRLDKCGEGFLRVDGAMDLNRLELFEERYDTARANFDFRWVDTRASHLGIELDVPSVVLRKGSGTALGSFTMRSGGVVEGHAIATSVPLSRIQGAGGLGAALVGSVSAVAEVSGSVDELAVDAHVTLSQLGVGGRSLPASDFAVNLRPEHRKLRTVGKTGCGRPVPAEFDRAAYEKDERDGVFHMNGQLFGGQVKLDDVKVTRQRAKLAWGTVKFAALDIGALSEASPAVAASGARLEGKLSGKLAIEEIALEKPASARATLAIAKLDTAINGMAVALLPRSRPIVIRGGRLDVGGLALSVTTPGGHRGAFDMRGSVTGLGESPEVDARLELRPTDLSAFAGVIPRAERASGAIRGFLTAVGPVSAPRFGGGLELENGELVVRGLSSPLTKMNVAISVDSDEIRVVHGSARLGGGTLAFGGTAPIVAGSLGSLRATLSAKKVALAPVDGVEAVVDAELAATVDGTRGEGERSLPIITGTVTVESFEYTRPVTMAADISTLARRGRVTRFEAYDPDEDQLALEITLRAPRPLAISNNLVELELELGREGLLLTGTNQRFGARGGLRIKPGGRIQFRRNEFEVTQGTVRFDDPTEISPRVDVTATTEYRRYATSGGGETSTGPADTGGAASAGAGGLWDISMHAYGDAERLRIDLTSDPELAQDDIFLLLTLGLTRAELDQAQSASLGESVALEALSTLTGADQEVKKAIPVIDEFRFGSAYSSRTGRTEPTVTIGKRLAERIRAQVTTGLAESREIRSNLEWRLSPRVSVEGSYDNVNDISSSALGNLGADVRWRLEFD